MKRRSYRKKRVRWLPDTSFMSQLTMQNLASPSVETATATFDLLGTPGGSPQALIDAADANSLNYAREDVQNLLIDHIEGKVSWNIESSSSAEGATDASGIWRYFLRAAIVIVGLGNEANDAAVVPTFGGSALTGIAPDATVPWVLQGSYRPDGIRCLWRRSWFISVDWEAGAQATGTLTSNEDACPPGPYVDIHPRRLLRQNERLQLAFQVTCIGGPGAGGTSAVGWSHDLRTAAHNTFRRR